METELVTMPTNLIAQAIEKGATIETLEKLMALQERFEASENRKRFFNALSSFQSNCPVLKKTKLVSFKDVKYKYAPLSEIVKQIKDLLGKNGLTYRWEIKDDGKSLNVNCIVTHTSGHSEQTSMSASADTSGSKNEIQARGSSITYLQRYTLLGALGISSADTDNDGAKPEKSIDEMHAEYMKYFNILFQSDPAKYGKYSPDNWKSERTIENYKKAIPEIKKQADDLSRRAN
jgi:hypothetical protein